MYRKRVQAVVLAAAAVAGYAGAATVSALALPAVQVATDFGPGDGLTRYVLTADAGVGTGDLLAALGGVDGVVNAQQLSDGRALVATAGLAPHHLEALPGVAEADVSPSVPVLGEVTDPFWPGYGWNLDNTGRNAYQQATTADADVDAPEGWGGGTGDGVVVAVVDTGFDSDHPDLAGALWTNPAEACGSVDRDLNGKAGDCHGWNFATNSADVDNGANGTHGATVSGVLGARAGNGQGSAGVAPGVTIMPLVIGSGSSVDVTLGAEAIRYAVDHGADVVNASWGGPASGWALENLRSAVAYAAEHGVVVVAAAGNDGADRDRSPMYPASLTEANVVTVGSSTAADAVSDFSAYGARSVDLFAPGTLVFTTWNDGGYRLVSGTSIAAPQVAAAYALHRAARPDAPAPEVVRALLDGVDPLPAFAGRSVTGGRLSVGSLATAGSAALRYTFTSMSAPAGVVAPRITANGAAGSGDYAVTLGLGMAHEGEIWAVSGAELTVGGTTLATDDTGTARFPLGTAPAPADLDLSPTVELGDGRYVLTVQLHRDGVALGRAHAAPLLVGSAVVSPPAAGSDGDQDGDQEGDGGDGTPGDPAPGTPAPGGTAPGGGSDGSDGSADPGTGDGTDGGSGSTPETPSGGTAPETPDVPSGAETPDATDGADGGDTPDGSVDAGEPPAGGTAPGTPDAPSGADTPDAPDTPDGPDGGDSPDAPGGSGAPAPEDGGEATYPEVGPFGITSMSPTRVGTAGGTLVTITGTALPDAPRVRIGDSSAAEVVRWSATELVFRAPARVAGVYDVHVFARDGRNSVLEDALTYADAPRPVPPGDLPDTGGPAPEKGDEGSGPADPAAPGTPGDGTTEPGALDESAGDDEPEVRTGPGGQRLVRNATFAALGRIWATDCSVSCLGVPI